MSSVPTVPTAALFSPRVRAVRRLYLTVFLSIVALAAIIRGEGVPLLTALAAASGVAIVAVAVVNGLLGRGVRPTTCEGTGK